jgi:uncharacterized protein (DUF1697 family)
MVGDDDAAGASIRKGSFLKKRTKKLLHLDPVSYVALLRGVNVGRANRIAMADLRAAVEELGYTEVRTLLNSGNVIFCAPAGAAGVAEASIAAALAKLGVTTRVIVLPVAELHDILAAHPFPDIVTDPARLLVAVFAGGAPLPRVAALAAQDWGIDRMALLPRAAFLWCASGILESPLLKAFSRAAGDTATTRNWTTMTKLVLG